MEKGRKNIRMGIPIFLPLFHVFVQHLAWFFFLFLPFFLEEQAEEERAERQLLLTSSWKWGISERGDDGL